ncbi:MAG: hypothetical protein A2991_01130 [Candidatus Terrybacteria bacterium RIFCSPLOWO2_01_FULL_58_14]|uniref:CYTH domain-containing protein n=2 Tax=Candidatus Terryibacteriota TaxID=1817920 RepID=A0A1G2Q0D3_9BACT|nr:MAG: hypothetical protein A2682_01870 [Candidatus Terrybacteria bacterium RIFCSPHIGHO2_01_FULL_58_15]OHA54030.1 MAG: hypothetical protein A2991_01130 [Candidatus Terrybacteria bacterium RIFCSPLOWO2_01_FULL_58_14]
MREVELKWRITDAAFREGLWRLAIDEERIMRFRALMPHLRQASDDELRARFGPDIIGNLESAFERNIIYRTPEGVEVRLRMTVLHRALHGNADRHYELALKGPPDPDSEFQDRDEQTLPLGSPPGNLVEGFLRRLGWEITDVYEDHRTDLRLGGVLISKRVFPVLGTWMEIEGMPEGILRCAQSFGLTKENAVRKGWRTIWREYCEAHFEAGYDSHQLTFSAVRFKRGGGHRQ